LCNLGCADNYKNSDMDSSQTLRTTAPFVMLREAKHPCAGFLAGARNDRKSMLGMTKKRARNDETECAE